MEFKDRLVQLRKELNLTQEEFALKIGFSRTAVSAWETGRNEPSNADTIKIADFFGVSVDYLVGKTDIRNNNGLDNVRMASYNGVDVNGLSNKEIEEIKQFVEFVRNKNKK